MKQTLAVTVVAVAGFAVVPNVCSAGEWGLGLGVAAQEQPQAGGDTQVVVLPFPSYEGERLSVRFDEPRYGVAPGQAVVCYDGDRVLGGGWIEG